MLRIRFQRFSLVLLAFAVVGLLVFVGLRSGVPLALVVGGGLLQVGGLVFTLFHIRRVIGIRAETKQGIVEALHWLGGRKSASVHARTARAYASGTGTARADVVVVGETETERLDREVRHLAKRMGELEAELQDKALRISWEMADRFSDMKDDLGTQSKAEARLSWWGVVVVGLGIVVQTVGSVLP